MDNQQPIRLQSSPVAAVQSEFSLYVFLIAVGTFVLCFAILLCRSAIGAEGLRWVALLPLVSYILLPLCMLKQQVVAEPECIGIKAFGKMRWGMAASQLQFIAMVGDDRDVWLCLSGYTIDELAQKREQQLLKNWFSKDEVPLRKRKAGWQEIFAKEYLLKIALGNEFAAWRPNGLIILPADTMLLALLRKLYPQLTYYNLSPRGYDRMEVVVDDNVPVYLSDYKVQLGVEGVLIRAGKKPVWNMPKEQIRSVVSIDVFRENRYSRRYRQILMISSLSLKELADSAPKVLFEEETQRLGLNQEQRAIAYCRKRYERWSPKNLWMCPVLGTEKNRQQLQEYYPDAQWIDLSHCWLENSNAPTTGMQ